MRLLTVLCIVLLSTPCWAQNAINTTATFKHTGTFEVTSTSKFGDIINTDNNWVSGDGGAEGIHIADDGNVGIGGSTPKYTLDVMGTFNVTGTSKFGDIINTDNNYISGDGGAEGVYVDDSGNVGIGTTAPTNWLQLGTPVWDDIRVSAERTKANPSAKPDYSAYINGTYTYLFDDASSEWVTFSVQMPHSMVSGTVIEPHIHWASIGTGTSDVVWGLEYTKAGLNRNFGNAVSCLVVASERGVANHHILTRFPDINMSGDGLSAMILFNLSRHGDNASDTSTTDSAFLEFDLHYQLDKFGSMTNTSY